MTRTAALDAVRREGKRVRTPRLEVRYIASLSRSARVGIVVPKHKRTAVARNLVKRRLRELVRTTLLPGLAAVAPLDLVVRAAPEAYGADLATLAADLATVLARLRTRPA
ncbi:MAG: ribonuclease P protein component [Gemmatimonadaceae bacterium]|nr:ribonuclease P protein component [Gemmatimonadaceae bacterium]